jgi:hypothetical protein
VSSVSTPKEPGFSPEVMACTVFLMAVVVLIFYRAGPTGICLVMGFVLPIVLTEVTKGLLGMLGA